MELARVCMLKQFETGLIHDTLLRMEPCPPHVGTRAHTQCLELRVNNEGNEGCACGRMCPTMPHLLGVDFGHSALLQSTRRLADE